MHTLSLSCGCRGLRAIAALCMLIILSLSAPSGVSAKARLVIDAAERERWYGEDNLYGENYGRRKAINGYVSVFRYDATVSWFEQTTWDQTEADQSVSDYEIHSFGSSVDVYGDILVVSAPDSRKTDSPYEDGPGFVFI